MLHFSKDWWKFIQINQYYTKALKIREITGMDLIEACIQIYAFT